MYRRLKSLFGPMTMVFDQDPNTPDPNDPNAGDLGGKVAGGGGGGAKADTHKVTIDGTEQIFTTDELYKMASKAGGADKAFREAAQMKKDGSAGIRIKELVTSIGSSDAPDEAEVAELAALLDTDISEFKKYMSDEDPQPKSKEKQPPVANFDFDAEFSKRFGRSPAEVKAQLDFSNERHVRDAGKEIREISDKAVDKDEIIGKMIVGKDSDKVKVAVKEMVAEEVLGKIKDGVPFGAEMVTESVQRVRTRLTNLGIPNKPTEHPIVLGLAPGQELPSEIHADEPIKRLSSVDDKDEKNVIARYMQKAIKAIRDRR